MAVAPDLGPCSGGLYERIVLRHRAVVIQTQGLARERIHLLRQIPIGRIAGRDVKLAVRAKAGAHPGVIWSTGNVFDDCSGFRKFAARVFITHHFDAFAVAVVGVGEIDEIVGRELRMNGNVHQPALARWLDVRHGEDRFFAKFAVLNYANAATAFGDEHVLIRQPGKAPRHFEARRDRLDAKLNAIGRHQRFPLKTARRHCIRAAKGHDHEQNGEIAKHRHTY